MAPSAGPVAPGATYRVQLNRHFTFDDAASIVPYLADLGVTHLYCSPILQAAPGSTHGYDVVDHGRLNAELGGEESYGRLCRALADAGLGQVLDIVPNHMAVAGRPNAWWWDVLENGPSSRYAAFFDIDWDPPEHKLRNTVLLPVLDDHYGRVLEAGRLAVRREGAAFHVDFSGPVAPVAPTSLAKLVRSAAEAAASPGLAAIAAGLAALPVVVSADRALVERRHLAKEAVRQELEHLLAAEPDAVAAIDHAVAVLNLNHDALDGLLTAQNYRLAYWRVAGDELDYRRFFDIPNLVGLRVEEPEVFAATHRRILELVHRGVVDGLRVDHPDGMRDPAGYLDRLHRETGGAYVVVEKILEPDEVLNGSWPVAGTTGYDFLNTAGGLFVDPDGESPLTDLYAEITGRTEDFPTVLRARKLAVMHDVLAADVNRLTNLFVAVCEHHRRFRDYTRRELRDALSEAAASFPVYRSYLHPRRPPSEQDLACVQAAVTQAGAARPDIDPELFAFLQDILTMRFAGDDEADLALRFQQLTGPVMAKGVEDTAFYLYNRLVSLNEVGGDPGCFGVSVQEFHAHNHRIATDWPSTLLATATHDTKRGEDVRARISLLSQIPGVWAATVRRWVSTNERQRCADMPDRNDEYLLYQTLVGAFPLSVERAAAYMEKASREAKENTSWTRPDDAYDRALRDFVEGVMGDDAFQRDLAAFVATLAPAARAASLAQTMLKLTCPGVPDLYRGTELWDLSVVDPDNRRPVDHDLRRRLLDKTRDMDPTDVWQWADEGAPKLWLTHRALDLRAHRPSSFAPGASYDPLPLSGESASMGVAYCRDQDVAVVVPRLALRLAAAANAGVSGNGWGDTTVTLPPGRWVDHLSGASFEGGGRTAVADLLSASPVALLTKG